MVDERDKVLRQGFAVLGRAIREQPLIFTLAVGGSAVYGFMTVASAWVIGRVIDRVIVPAFADGRTTSGALTGAGLLILAVSVLKACGIVGRRLGAGVMQYRLQAAYRQRVTRQYLRLPLSWHHRHPTGQLLSNANADVEATFFVIAPLPMAIGVLVMLAVAGGAMVLTDLVLALVGFLVFPALFVLNVVYQRRLSPLATRAQQLRAEVSEVAHESFDGALVVKTLGREADETRRFADVANELRDANIRVGRVRGFFDPALEALPNLGVLVVLLAGTARVNSGAIAPGDLVKVAYLFTLLAFPVRSIGWVLGELPRSVVGWERVDGVLQATGALPFGDTRMDGDEGASSIELRDVSFSYGDVEVLHHLNLAIPAGSAVALVGPTGAGKSTLTNLLVRLVDPASGEVRLDGVDLRDMAPGEAAAVASVVPQQTFLFDDTVRGNVTLSAEIDDADVWEALRLAQAEGFVRALHDGLDTRVGERGTSLSGGQRQRVALARALVRHPRVLVLDDATSSVDPHVEAQILAGLRRAELPSTVVMVAYRKATIALADEVVLLEHGRITDRGTHDELMERSEGYRSLVTAYEKAEAERAALERDALSDAEVPA